MYIPLLHLSNPDQCPPQVHAGPSLGSPKSYAQASVPSSSPLDRYLGAPITGSAAEQRENKVDYITLDNIDPSATEDEIYALLLQAIQDTRSAGYYLLFPLSMPAFITPPPMRPDAFPNWE